MPTIINPVITDAGLTAAINASGNGTQLAITHVVLGAGKYSPTNTSTIQNRREKVTIAGGFVSDVGAFRVNVLFPSWDSAPYDATEIGFFAGDPDAGGVLFAVYSHPTAIIVNRNSLDYVAQYGLRLSRVPAGSVTITVDPSASQALALIAAHEGATDPHAQYVRKSGSTSTGVQRMQGGLTAGAGAPATAAFAVHAHSGASDATMRVETDPGVDVNISVKRGATVVGFLRGVFDGLNLNGSQILRFLTGGVVRGLIDATGRMVLGSETTTGRLRIVAPTTENAETYLEGANPDRQVAHILRRNGAVASLWGVAGAVGHLAPDAAAGDTVLRNDGGMLRITGAAGIPGIDVSSAGVARIKQAIPANDDSDRATTTAWVQDLVALMAPTDAVTVGQLIASSGQPWRSVAGHVRLSSGILIQFGSALMSSASGSTGTVFSFPVAFVDGCYQIVANDFNLGAHSIGISPEGDGRTQYRIWARDAATGNPVDAGIRWIAIGR